jgi:hypothetical protein
MTWTVLPTAQVEVVEGAAVAKPDKRPAIALSKVVPVALLGLPAVLTQDQRASLFIDQISAGRSEYGIPS